MADRLYEKQSHPVTAKYTRVVFAMYYYLQNIKTNGDTVDMVNNVYGHLYPNRHIEVAEKLQEIVSY